MAACTLLQFVNSETVQRLVSSKNGYRLITGVQNNFLDFNAVQKSIKKIISF